MSSMAPATLGLTGAAAAGPRCRGVHRPLLALLVLIPLGLYACTIGRYGDAFSSADGHLYYLHAHSWYFDGDCDYANNLRLDPKLRARDYYLAQRSVRGQALNVFPCGWSVIALPSLALADLMTVVHNSVAGSSLPRDGFSAYYRAVVPLGHVLLGIAGLLVSYRFTCRYFSQTIAAAATLLVLLGTSVIYFVSFEPTMSHAGSFALVAMMVATTDVIFWKGWTLWRAVGLGVSMGLAAALRHQDIVWAAVPVVLLGPSLIGRKSTVAPGDTPVPAGPGSSWGYAATAAGAAILCLVPQVLVNLSIHGRVASDQGFFTPDWSQPRIARTLFSHPSGLLVLFPLVAVSLIGLLGLLRQRSTRRLAMALLIGFGALLYLNACGRTGCSRRFVSGEVAWVLGLAGILQWARSASGWAVVAGVLVGGVCLRNLVLVGLVFAGHVAPGLFNAWMTQGPRIIHHLAGLLPFR